MADSAASLANETPRKHTWLTGIASAYLTIIFPVLLVLLAARLVMTPLFLQIEYQRAGFPVDVYGFTTADRLRFAPFAVNYLLNGEEIAYLADMEFDEGGALFNARELHHMRDVKQVTQIAFAFGFINAIVAVFVAYFLCKRDALRRTLQRGAILTLGLIVAIVIGAVVAWDVFFTAFHNLFFTSGTWVFAYSDTLIRLFPEQFWFDAAIVIGGIVVGSAGITLVLTWLAGRSAD